MSSYLNLKIRLALASNSDFIVSHRVHLATVRKKRLYSRTRLLYTAKRNILKLHCKIYVKILKLRRYTIKKMHTLKLNCNLHIQIQELTVCEVKKMHSLKLPCKMLIQIQEIN
jgi:hypothetical protein